MTSTKGKFFIYINVLHNYLRRLHQSISISIGIITLHAQIDQGQDYSICTELRRIIPLNVVCFFCMYSIRVALFIAHKIFSGIYQTQKLNSAHEMYTHWR